MGSNDTPIRLDLNNPVFQAHLFGLQKPERNAAMDTLRITQSRRCTAYREGDFMRFLTVAPDHDSTYGRK
jgi:hypothetical protein